MGFVVNLDDVLVSSFGDVDHPTLLDQQQLARNLWRGLFAQINAHIKHFSHYMDGYPCQWIRRIEDPPEQRPATFAELMKDYDAYAAACKSAQHMFKKLAQRAMVGWWETLEMFEEYRGRYHPDHTLNAHRILNSTGDTVCIEKHFQVKSDQCKDSASLRQSTASLWRGPIRGKVLSKIFKFQSEFAVTMSPMFRLVVVDHRRCTRSNTRTLL